MMVNNETTTLATMNDYHLRLQRHLSFILASRKTNDQTPSTVDNVHVSDFLSSSSSSPSSLSYYCCGPNDDSLLGLSPPLCCFNINKSVDSSPNPQPPPPPPPLNVVETARKSFLNILRLSSWMPNPIKQLIPLRNRVTQPELVAEPNSIQLSTGL